MESTVVSTPGQITSKPSRPPRYSADIAAGSLKIGESRLVADLLLQRVDAKGWKDAIFTRNILKARQPATARRFANLIRSRLETMGPELWRLVRDGNATVATHATLAAAVKQSRLLADFLRLVVAEHHRVFSKNLSRRVWDEYLSGCRERDPEMPDWSEATKNRLRSSVFQTLAQAGYIANTRSLRLQAVHVSEEVLRVLKSNGENAVLRCLQVSP